jgi:hypothetical protein
VIHAAAASDDGLLFFVPHLGVAAGLVFAIVALAWKRRGHRPDPRPLPEPSPPERGVGNAWEAAFVRFAALSTAYAEFECDPVRVAQRPALSDVEVPSTARFVDSYTEALALRTEEQPAEPLASRFITAVRRATITWAVAVETAERVASSRLPPHERSVLARVVKLLVLARDSDSEPERRAAYTRARIELERLDTAGLVRLPAPARAVLDAGARGEITA